MNSSTQSKTRLWKKPSMDWLNKPKVAKINEPSPLGVRVHLNAAQFQKGDRDSTSESEESPETKTTERMNDMSLHSPSRIGPSGELLPWDASPRFEAVRSLSSKEVLVKMLDDPKCLWKFGQYLSYDVAAETLIFYLNAEQHRQDLQRLHNLTRRVHALHIPTTAALALNISAMERAALEKSSEAFLQLKDPFTSAREAALRTMLSDTWPRFIRHRLDLLYHLELRTMGIKAGVLDLGTCFCISSAKAQDDYAIMAISNGFTATTGFSRHESVGRNCRFLQGPGTDKSACKRLGDACREGIVAEELLLNYRSDGTPFQNYIRIFPMRDSQGVLVAYLGYQVNVVSKHGIGPLLDDRLDQFDERLPAHGSSLQQEQQKQTANAFAEHMISASKPDTGVKSVTREMRLSEAAMLALGHTARKPAVAPTKSPSMQSGGRPTTASSSTSARLWKRASIASFTSGGSEQVEPPTTPIMGVQSAPAPVEDKNRWLYLDAGGATVVHSCPELQATFAPGVDFVSVIKRDNALFLKKLKAAVKTGDALYERAKVALDPQRPTQLSDVATAIVPMLDREAKVSGIVILFGLSGLK